MNRLILSIIGFFTGGLCYCGQHNFKTVDADEFEHVISADGVQVVDVRTAGEFSEAHIEANGIMNIDVKQHDFMAQAKERLSKSRPVAVYCRSGRRSADAAGMLSEEGYNVTDLKGGILEWQKRGKKTAKQD